MKGSMNIIIYEYENIPDDKFKIVANLLHDAFAERSKQNLDFKCMSFSASDIENIFKKEGYLLMAYDDNYFPIATISLFIRKKGRYLYGSTENLAVLDNFKGKGIGKRIFQDAINLAIRKKLDFVSSSTATKADSSVLLHQKLGFKIYEKRVGEKYSSFSFIYPISKFKFLNFCLIRKSVYIIFTLKNRIFK